MQKYLPAFLVLFTLFFGCTPEKTRQERETTETIFQSYLTTADSSHLFTLQPVESPTNATQTTDTIRIDPTQEYQEMDGFGFTLTGGSAQLLHALPDDQRAALLQELFGTETGDIGISYLRLSLGASDLDAEVFSYADGGPGTFSLDPDRRHLIPVLKEILEINPEIKLMSSPWSPPVWMKDNGNSKGGSLKPESHAAYAEYFVDYLQGMKDEGIRIDAVTVQNEPLHPGNNPSLLMLPQQQATFVGQYLGPALAAAGLDTKIIVYDHNADRPDYPMTIFADSLANTYSDGSAFHLYGGEIEALTQVHEAYPEKNLYFTEQWIGSPGDFAEDFRWHMRELIIKAPRNWCRTVLEWNLAADAEQNPHTPGGCTRCLGALTIDGDRIKRNTAYYIVAHAAKLVRPGSVRIASGTVAGLPNVAYRTPEGNLALIVLNDSEEDRDFAISRSRSTSQVAQGSAEEHFITSLPSGAAATYLIQD